MATPTFLNSRWQCKLARNHYESVATHSNIMMPGNVMPRKVVAMAAGVKYFTCGMVAISYHTTDDFTQPRPLKLQETYFCLAMGCNCIEDCYLRKIPHKLLAFRQISSCSVAFVHITRGILSCCSKGNRKCEKRNFAISVICRSHEITGKT